MAAAASWLYGVAFDELKRQVRRPTFHHTSLRVLPVRSLLTLRTPLVRADAFAQLRQRICPPARTPWHISRHIRCLLNGAMMAKPFTDGAKEPHCPLVSQPAYVFILF